MHLEMMFNTLLGTWHRSSFSTQLTVTELLEGEVVVILAYLAGTWHLLESGFVENELLFSSKQ